MVNTVGSYENKHWQKKWPHLKRDVVFSRSQKSLIIGSLLGDATMRIGKGAVNANFKVEQGLMQREYTLWKYDILRSLVLTGPKLSFRNDKNGTKYEKSWWFRTIRHPELTKIYKVFYKGEEYRCGRKIVPKNIEKLIDPMALAVWIMDDGSYSKGKIDISTYSFSLSEIKLLQSMFANKFRITMRFYSDRDKGYRMYCNTEETKKLVEVISPYIVETMVYKIGFRNPVTTQSKRLELSVTG